MTREYVVHGPSGPVYINEESTRDFGVEGAYVNTTTSSGPTYTLTAGTGTFTLTGQAAGLVVGRKLAAGTGVFTLTGVAAGLVVGRKLAAGTGVFTLTGQPANISKVFMLAAGTGVFTLTGQPAGLIVGRRLAADVGAFTLTGNDVNLVYSGASYTPAPIVDRIGYVLEDDRIKEIDEDERVVVILEDIDVYNLPERSVEDDLDYGAEFAKWLKPGDSIASKTVTTSRGDTLAYGDVIQDTMVAFWLKNGTITTDPEIHYIDVKIVTVQARKRKIRFQIPVTA